MKRLVRLLSLLVLLGGCELLDEMKPGVPAGPLPDALLEASLVLTDSLPLPQAALHLDERQQLWALQRNGTVSRIDGRQISRLGEPTLAGLKPNWVLRGGVLWCANQQSGSDAAQNIIRFHRFANGTWQSFPEVKPGQQGWISNLVLDERLNPVFILNTHKTFRQAPVRWLRFDGQKLTDALPAGLNIPLNTPGGLFAEADGTTWLHNSNGKRGQELIRIAADWKLATRFDLADGYSRDALNDDLRLLQIRRTANGNTLLMSTFGSCYTSSLAVMDAQKNWQTLAPPQYPDACSGVVPREVLEVAPGEYLLGGDALYHFKEGTWTRKFEQYSGGIGRGISLVRDAGGRIWYSTEKGVYRIEIR